MAWNIDTSHSYVGFAVKHMMITTVRGQFGSFSGTVHVNEEQPALSSVEGTVDTTTINTGDENRDAHLRSADFFDVESYPVMSFRSTRVDYDGGDEFRVVGELTIKDVTREIVLEVTDEGGTKDPWGNQKRAFSAETTINRKDFGLTWNVALESGGLLVADKVKITIDLQLVQTQEEALEAAAV